MLTVQALQKFHDISIMFPVTPPKWLPLFTRQTSIAVQNFFARACKSSCLTLAKATAYCAQIKLHTAFNDVTCTLIFLTLYGDLFGKFPDIIMSFIPLFHKYSTFSIISTYAAILCHLCQ